MLSGYFRAEIGCVVHCELHTEQNGFRLHAYGLGGLKFSEYRKRTASSLAFGDLMHTYVSTNSLQFRRREIFWGHLVLAGKISPLKLCLWWPVSCIFGSSVSDIGYVCSDTMTYIYCCHALSWQKPRENIVHCAAVFELSFRSWSVCIAGLLQDVKLPL